MTRRRAATDARCDDVDNSRGHRGLGDEEDPETAGPPGDPEAVARIVCLRLLDRRARTRAELAEALCKRGVPDDAATRVLDRFTEVGLIDDAAVADSYAQAQHLERGLSSRAVAMKLRRRGVDDDTVRTTVDRIDQDSELAVARQLVEKRLRSLSRFDPEVRTRRLVGLLARKGYSSAVAYGVVRDVMAEHGVDPDHPAWSEAADPD